MLILKLLATAVLDEAIRYVMLDTYNMPEDQYSARSRVVAVCESMSAERTPTARASDSGSKEAASFREQVAAS